MKGEKKEREKKKEEQEGYHGNDSNQGYQGQKKKGSRARERRGPNDQYKKKNQHPRKVRKTKGKYNGKSKTKTQKL